MYPGRGGLQKSIRSLRSKLPIRPWSRSDPYLRLPYNCYLFRYTLEKIKQKRANSQDNINKAIAKHRVLI